MYIVTENYVYLPGNDEMEHNSAGDGFISLGSSSGQAALQNPSREQKSTDFQGGHHTE